MRKVFYVCLILCAVLLVYVGCKKRTKSLSEPMCIYSVIYSDTNDIGTVGVNDELFVVFDRHITLASNPVDSVFELSGGGDSFGTGASMDQTSGHALTITLGTGASLQSFGDGTITSTIRVSSTVPWGAIKDNWNTSMTGGGSFTTISGRLGYVAPIILSAVYTDVDASGTPTQNDTIVVTFTGDIDTSLTGGFPPGWVFILPVTWDHFGGSGVSAQKTAGNVITINVGAGAKFTVNGTHAVGSYTVDSSSGLDVRIELTSGFLTYDAGGVAVPVPPCVADLE